MGNSLKSQRGNVFFALFGAVAFVGVLGAATMSYMKGPLKTSVNLSRMSVAQTQMQVGTQMAVLQASAESDSGDCDSDGYVEPMEWEVQADDNLRPNAVGGVGTGAGGNISNSLGATKQDPWGRLYGYCVWNNGSNTAVVVGGVGGTPACDDDGDTNEQRLEGSPNDYDVVLAVISAGPDRVFQTVCQTFDAADVDNNLVLGDPGDTEMIYKSSGSDDIILSYTYAEAASVGGGGLWSIKSSDPATAIIDKAIEFTGGMSMGNEVDVTVCGASTANVMRYNTFTDVIQVCDGAGAWNDIAGGASAPAGNDTEVQFNDAGSAGADAGLTYDKTNDALTIDGSVTLGSTTGADLPILIETPTISGGGSGLWTAGTGDDIYYDTGSTEVGIGTATPTATLHISETAATTIPLLIENTSAGSDPALVVANTNGGGNAAVIGLNVSGSQTARIQAFDSGTSIIQNGNFPLGFYTNNGARIYIEGGGDIGIGGNVTPDVALDVTGDIEYTGTITDVSDIRLKDDIKPLESSLDKITSLTGISFKMKDDEDDRVEFGFSAQEVQKVYPELIKTAEDEMGSLSMNYVGLIAPLVESVKELKAENEELRDSIAELGGSDNSKHEKWLYILLGLFAGLSLSGLCRRHHGHCSKKEG